MFYRSLFRFTVIHILTLQRSINQRYMTRHVTHIRFTPAIIFYNYCNYYIHLLLFGFQNFLPKTKTIKSVSNESRRCCSIIPKRNWNFTWQRTLKSVILSRRMLRPSLDRRISRVPCRSYWIETTSGILENSEQEGSETACHTWLVKTINFLTSVFPSGKNSKTNA